MKRLKAIIGGENRALWIAGAAAFFVGAVATAPASLAAAAAKAQNPLLEIGGAEGTIWRGGFSDVSHDGIYLGAVSYRLHPLALLTGRLAADATANGGALSAKARISLSSGAIDISDVDARFNLAAIRRYTVFGYRYQGVASLTAERIALSKSACRAEGARLSTNALDAIARQWSGAALPLSGEASCVDGALVITLNGENADGGVKFAASISADLAYSMTFTAEPRRNEIGAALRAYGFEGDNRQLSYRAAGRLRGLTS
ncbi:MAG: type II secretion system protein N [Parvularculaceae bacterium]